MHTKSVTTCIYQLWFTNIDAHFQQDIGHIRTPNLAVSRLMMQKTHRSESQIRLIIRKLFFGNTSAAPTTYLAFVNQLSAFTTCDKRIGSI